MNRAFLGVRVRNWFVMLTLVAMVGWLTAVLGPGRAAAAKDGDSPAGVSSAEATDYAKSLSKAFREAAGKVLPAVVMVQSSPAVVERTKSREMQPTTRSRKARSAIFSAIIRNCGNFSATCQRDSPVLGDRTAAEAGSARA